MIPSNERSTCNGNVRRPADLHQSEVQLGGIDRPFLSGLGFFNVLKGESKWDFYPCMKGFGSVRVAAESTLSMSMGASRAMNHLGQ